MAWAEIERAAGGGAVAGALAVCRQIAEQLPDPLLIVDRQYIVCAANAAYLRFRGEAAEQLIGRPLAEVVSSEAFEALIRPPVDRALAGEHASREAWIDHPGVGRCYIELHLYPLRIAEQVRLAAVLIRDLSERKRAEEALAEGERRFRTVLDSLPDIITRFDRDLRYTFISPNVERISGSPISAYLGKTPRETGLFDEATLAASEEHSRRALETGEVQTFEHPVSTPQGTLYYSVRIIPERDAEGRVLSLLNISQDVTARKRAEMEREQLLRNLREVNERLTATSAREQQLAQEAERRAAEAEAALRLRDEFLDVAAHELKTPLTSLKGQAELTMRRIERGRLQDQQQIYRALQVIDRQAERLTNLVTQLLIVSRIEAGELPLARQRVDLVRIVRELVETMQAAAPRHTLSLRAPASLTADVDPARLEEVLYNLIDNAIRYSPEGGPVEIELLPVAGTARIAVRDYGIGVAAEQRGRLFTRFFQASPRPVGGLGLSLYVSRRIVERHGGRIWAEFPEEGGSRFVVEVPLEPSEGVEEA